MNQKEKIFKIVLTGGGSGGHLIPLIAITRELKKILGIRVIFYYLGPADLFTKELLEKEEIKVIPILTGKIRRYFTLSSLFLNFIDFFKIIGGIIQSLFLLIYIWPKIIFSKGGFGSFPVTFAGWLLNIPIFLHESDSILGLSNQIISKFSQKIFISFPETENVNPKKAILVGNPIRLELLGMKKEEGRAFFQIKNEKPVVLILGGSQGAQRINEKILMILERLLKISNVIHQCGERNLEKIKKLVQEIITQKELLSNYYLFGFLNEDQLKAAYGAADVIVARAGSGTIFEIAALGKASILVPLPESAQNHQLRNAYLFSKGERAILIEERYLTPQLLLERIEFLLFDRVKREIMENKAREFGNPSSANLIANYLISHLTKL